MQIGDSSFGSVETIQPYCLKMWIDNSWVIPEGIKCSVNKRDIDAAFKMIKEEKAKWKRFEKTFKEKYGNKFKPYKDDN